MPRTAEILREQQWQADVERRRPKPPMPQGLTPLQQLQCGLWGWCDMRSRTKQKFQDPKPDYSPEEIAAIVEAISPEMAAIIGDNMKKDDAFPSPYLKCADLNGHARVLTIKAAPYETLKNKGKEQQKTVLHFKETFKGKEKLFPLNVTNWDSVCAATGESDTDDWLDKQIEVYPDRTPMDGKMVDCIRVRAPTKASPRKKEATPQPQPKPALAAPSEEADDGAPFEWEEGGWEQEDRSGVRP
jgi:hypothetical protein